MNCMLTGSWGRILAASHPFRWILRRSTARERKKARVLEFWPSISSVWSQEKMRSLGRVDEMSRFGEVEWRERVLFYRLELVHAGCY